MIQLDKALGLAEKPDDAGKFDLVVVGWGMAGTCTALSTAKLGVKVALIQDRPVLGGNNSSEVRVLLSARINLEPYPALGNQSGRPEVEMLSQLRTTKIKKS